MTKHNRAFCLFFIAFTSICIAACDRVKDPCLLPRVAPVGIGTYKAVETDTGVYIKDSLLPSPIIGVLDSPRVFVHVPAQPLSKFAVSLSPNMDSTKYFVLPDTLHRTIFDVDTLTVYYTRKLHFLSTACGYTYFFSLLDVKSTNHVIDSVKIIKTEVNNTAGVEHVKIYY